MRDIHGLGRLPLVEIDETGKTLINIFDESGMIGVVEKNRVNYLLKDHLGSTRVVVDEAGEKRGELNYSDFGETTISGDLEDIRYRYTGQEWDEEVGEYNYLAREYDPATGRFNSPDPAREGFSPYVYVGNNPINFVDPDGKVGYSLSRDRYSAENFQVDLTIKKWDWMTQKYLPSRDSKTLKDKEMSISRYSGRDVNELMRLGEEINKWLEEYVNCKDLITDVSIRDHWEAISFMMQGDLVEGKNDFYVARDGNDNLLGVSTLNRSEECAVLNLALRDPQTLVTQLAREEGTVGNVGAQLGNRMINDAFSEGVSEVMCFPANPRVEIGLVEKGFIRI